MNRLTKALGGLTVAAGLVLGGAAIAMPATAATADPPIPRCINDDYNDGTQAICYTERVDDGQVILIDRTDTIVADMSSRKPLKSCSYYGYVGSICKFTTSQSANNTGIQSNSGTKYYAK